jgi:hypothetical protein
MHICDDETLLASEVTITLPLAVRIPFGEPFPAAGGGSGETPPGQAGGA